jgi:lipopolysaccharide transport system ATP-binding protein
MTPAIRIESIGKRYRVRGPEASRTYQTLRESLTNWAKSPFQRRSVASEEFWALRDVSFEVQPGEVVGIIGRNGAGKSTLLKVLSRITRPTTGRVELHGRVGSLLEVGTGFHPELTGRENVYLNGSILGMSRKEIERRFDEIVAFAEVERFLDTPVKRYSSGMYVRLAFAVAAHLDPEVLIIDEVLAVGDADFQKKCLDKLNSVGRSGRTVLFVSHNMAAVERLCNRGVLIAGGRTVAQGTAAAVVSEYRNQQPVTRNSAIDLGTHPARKGGRFPRLRQLVVSSRGSERASVRMGESLELTIEYDCGEKPVDLKIGIIVEDTHGVKLLCVSPTYQAPALLRGSPARGTAKCTIGSVPLVEGYYRLNVYYDDGRETENIEPACEVEVLPADVFDTGRVPEARNGLFFTPCTWQASQEPDRCASNVGVDG